MTRRPVTGAVALSTVAFFGVGSAAMAQTAVEPTSTAYQAETGFYGRGKNTSVMERDRPEYVALGLHEGGVTVYPMIDIAADYNSNVFATSNHTASDEYVTVKPSVLVQSNWGRHGLQLYADVLNEDYVRYHTENELGYTVRADGRIDVHGQSAVNLGASSSRAYEPRGNIYTLANSVTPVHFDSQKAYGRGAYVQDRARYSLEADFANDTYYNVKQTDGTTADEVDRDQYRWDVGPRVDYALTPDTAVFGKVNYGGTTYERGPVALRRDSETVQVLSGVNFDITALARGEIGLGYFERTYREAIYRNFSSFSVGAKVEYFPTTLLTLTAIAQRKPQDAAFNTSSGFVQNNVSLGADYELRRNWLVSALFGYESDNFEGLSRHDQVENLVLTSRYYVSRNVGVGANVAYVDRGSDGNFPGPSYKGATVGVFLVLQR
jgi:hypothetical protein